MSLATNLQSVLWGVADLLRGPFKQSEYGRVILPFTVLRRLECVLEPTRAAVLKHATAAKEDGIDPGLVLPDVAGAHFYNLSQYSLATLGQTNPRGNLEDYVSKFSPNARGIFDHFGFTTWLDKLENANLLYLVAQKFSTIDLHPTKVSNMDMGHVFEHLVYKFAESANDTAGEYYTPRDIVRLATTLVIAPDHDALAGQGVIRSVYDPAAGTGGFLSAAIEQVLEWNPNARLVPYAQELNGETYAIQVADKLIQGYDTTKLKLGNTLSDDQLAGETFDYALSNPPFGTDWKGFQASVEAEHKRGYAGRFGPGLPRVSDASMLFLLHLLSKRRSTSEGGSRMGIVLSGSPLFTGGAGSGESEIRRWILENDLLEAIVALPTDLFYNTGIATYIWILSNAKEERRKGLVQLIDATDQHSPMRKSLGSKRKLISDEQIAEIARLHDAFEETPKSKIFPYRAFGFRRITIERPLKLTYTPEDPDRLAALQDDKAWARFDASDRQALLAALATLDERIPSRTRFERALQAALKSSSVKLSAAAKKLLQKHLSESDDTAEVCMSGGQTEPDPSLRDYENVPLGESIEEYVTREVLPHVPDAWVDESKADAKDGKAGIVGYEIPFSRHFYVFNPPRTLEMIDRELSEVTERISNLIGMQSPRSVDAVSGGLLGHPLVPSELPWLEWQAAHWPVVRIRFVARLGSGHTPSRSHPEYWENCTIPWITTGEVSQIRDDRLEYLTETRERISELGLRNSAAVIHPAGTVVLSRTASAGFSAIMGRAMATSQDFVTWTCGPRLRPRFLLLCLRAMRADLLGRLAMGSTHKTIYFPDIEDLAIPLPSLDEQDAAVVAAWTGLRSIDDTLDALSACTALLQERRASQTAAAVAGRLGGSSPPRPGNRRVPGAA